MSVTHLPGWTSPEAQLRILQSSRYDTALKEKLPKALADIVSSYIPENLGPNADNWYKALRNIYALPQSIPPLPVNVHEILTSICPIEGAPNRLTDTHSLWLIPGGIIKDIDALAMLCGEGKTTQFFGPQHPGLETGLLMQTRTPETVGFEKPEWVIVSELMPGSLNQPLYEQNKMIEKVKFDSFMKYEILRFKYALAVHLLKIQVDGEGLWLKSGEPRRLTRVQESLIKQYPGQRVGMQCSHTVGSVYMGGRTVTVISCCPADANGTHALASWDNEVGIAVMCVGFSAKPAESSCVLS